MIRRGLITPPVSIPRNFWVACGTKSHDARSVRHHSSVKATFLLLPVSCRGERRKGRDHVCNLMPHSDWYRCSQSTRFCRRANSAANAEKAMAAQIRCEDFKKNPNSSWTSGPNAKIGNMTFSNETFGVYAFTFSGVDPAVVLNQKCGGRPP